MARYRYAEDQVLKAIEGSFGITSKVARSLGCAWNTADSAIRRWRGTQRAFRDEVERALDLSESKLLEAVNAGDGPMIRFHLSTKGRNRGYIGRQEIAGVEGGPLLIEVVRRRERLPGGSDAETG